MNKQEKYRKDGSLKGRGIQWCDYSHNFTGGCQHDCKWTMPDGKIASCYAKDVAERVAGRAYPDGFEAHYWRPHQLQDPLKIKTPSRIFGDSMSDLFGHWVPDSQIKAVLELCRKADWHTFQFLTKNAPRLLQFEYPQNVWVGSSSPPDFMWGNTLTQNQQEKMLHKALDTLGQVSASVRWMSVEPLSWDVAPIFAQHAPLQWVVIGAATNGPKVFQPEPDHVSNLLKVLDAQKVPVFFKGNIWGNPAIKEWREYFPGFEKSRFMGMNLGKHALPVNEPVKSKKAIASRKSRSRNQNGQYI